MYSLAQFPTELGSGGLTQGGGAISIWATNMLIDGTVSSDSGESMLAGAAGSVSDLFLYYYFL